jgi:ferredoxin-NADP reductase
MASPRKIRCAITSITDHGERVYTLDLKPESPVPSFRPGQFLHLAIDEYDPSSFWPESRVFSVANSPAERHHLLVCYSVKGAFTTRMEHDFRVGSQVWAKLPYGDFVIEPDPEVVLFAGGTGVSAFTAFIGDLAATHTGRIHLYYGARSPELLLFRKELEQTLVRVLGFHLTYCLERGTLVPSNDFNSRLKIRQGRLSADFPAQDGFQNLATIFYLSGPPAMLKALSPALARFGVPAANIRIDAWE